MQKSLLHSFIYIFATLIFLFSTKIKSQDFRVLHYSETSGFDHNTRQSSLLMLEQMGAQYNFIVDDDQTGNSFNTLSGLQEYAVIVFANTSGNNILDSIQRYNFEEYIKQGGSFMGIHAASDTYRHSTANGSSTGSWDWYAELLGASVQRNPSHVQGTPAYKLIKTGLHTSTDNLPTSWVKDEEYYYWENGYYNEDNISVLKVEQTVGPDGNLNSYDSARPMSWYRDLSYGGRIFYTALGHASYNYTSDTDFQNHIRDALLWAAGSPSIGFGKDYDRELFDIYPNPVSTELMLENLPENWLFIEIRNTAGERVLYIDKYNRSLNSVDVSGMDNGNYFLIARSRNDIVRVQFVKN